MTADSRTLHFVLRARLSKPAACSAVQGAGWVAQHHVCFLCEFTTNAECNAPCRGVAKVSVPVDVLHEAGLDVILCNHTLIGSQRLAADCSLCM